MRFHGWLPAASARLILAVAWPLSLAETLYSAAPDFMWAQAAYRQVVGNPALNIKGTFQFEFHVFDKGDHERERHWREVFEQADGVHPEIGRSSTCGLLVMPENGIPFIYGSDHEIVLSNPRGGPFNYVLPDAGYFRSITGIKSVRTAPDLRFKGLARAWLGLDALLSEYYGAGFVVVGDSRARTVRVPGPGTSYARLRVTRERRAMQFPITSLFLDCDTSQFHDRPCEVMLTNFYVSQDQMPEGALPRPIRDIHPDQGAGVFRSAPATGGNAADWLAENLKWMHDPVRCERVLSDPTFQAAGREILTRLRPHDAFTADEAKRVSDDLRHLTAAARGGASQGDVQAASTALDHLAGFLADRVVAPVRIESWRSPVPTYLAGHERWRTANMLDGRAGPELAASVYAALRAVVLETAAPLDLRLRALDLLGEIGVAETSSLLAEMEDALRHGRGKPVPDELDAMFSTVKVRTGLPDDNDVARIKKQLADPNASAVVRGACLEALLLEDETSGLEPLIYQTVASPLQWKLDFPTRCLFAAGLSDEGRNVLKRILVERKPEALFKPVLYLVDTSVRPGDAQWEACQEVAERLALDEHSDLDLRLKASQIAARSVEHVTFRSKYIRAALRSGNLRLIEALALEREYLRGAIAGHIYAADFARAMASAAPPVRAALGTLFVRSCPRDWPPQFDDGIKAMLRLFLAENTPQSLDDADSILLKLAVRRPAEARQYLSLLIAHAKAQSNPNAFYWKLSGIAIWCKLPLKAPYLPRYYDSSDEGGKLIAQHRKELEAQADAWLKGK